MVRSTSAIALALAAFIAGVGPVYAGEDDPERVPTPSAQPARARRDFYFARPLGTIGLRGSWTFARAGSDLFEFVQDQLTIDKKDFNGPTIAAELGLTLKPRLELVTGLAVSQTSTGSEYREFVDNNRRPIQQTTRLKTVDLSGSVRYALLPRGYAVSRLAWVPRGVIPYIGAGAGAMWYEFEQAGDFVDFVDLSVFSDVFRSQGWTPSAHAFGGVDVRIHRRLFLTVEGRYVWAHATLDEDFVDFEPIDLAGVRMSTGLNFVF